MRVKKKLKSNIGLIILLVIALVFPTSLNYQARLNMRIIVTGLAVDKSGEDYQVTAQIVKTSPGTESPGTSAEIDFITDKAKNLSEAVSKLSYKAGKVAAFSHTNFVVIGKSLFEEDITKCLDYFIRDKIIKNSALLLFADGSADEEIKKTKNTELSVGLGLQKVFLYKENEGDGLMVTLIEFLNRNKMFSKSAVASELSMHTNEEAKKSEDSSSVGGNQSAEGESSSGSGTSGSSGSSNGEQSSETGSAEAKQGSSDSGGSPSSSQASSSGGASSSSASSESQYFDPEAPLVCFVDGMFVGKLDDSDSIEGYMLGNAGTRSLEIMIENVDVGRLDGEKMEIKILRKNNHLKFRYDSGDIPELEIDVIIRKSELNEIMSDEVIAGLTKEEFKAVKEALEKTIKQKITKAYDKAKSFKCDIFGAYELAYKFHYTKTTELFDSTEEFLENLKIKVNVNVAQLDY